MSSSESVKKASRAPSKSTELSIEIILLECGHGDTILVRLPGNRWLMIDCNLVSKTREKLFDIFKKYDVRKLDALILTHPHSDHYNGMQDVLEYFSKEGRELGIFCDCGVDPQQIYDLLDRAKDITDEEKSKYFQLQNKLDAILINNVARYFHVDENTDDLIRFKDFGDKIRLIPIGPDPAYVRSMQRKALDSENVRSKLNALSLILLLQISQGEGYFNVLFTGDAQAKGLERALTIWRSGEKTSSGSAVIRSLKIPHHGSATSICPGVHKFCRQGESNVAAISVGTKFNVLPDRKTLQDYLDAGWKVMLTTKRVKPKRRQRFFQVSGRSMNVEDEYHRHDLHISWDPSKGMKWEPEKALLDPSELKLYGSASS